MVAHPDIETVWQWLDEVPDPEIPVISLVDLGIVRDVAYSGNVLNVTLSPTYSGCPATRVIEQDVRNALVHMVSTNLLSISKFRPLDDGLDVGKGKDEIARIRHCAAKRQGTARGLSALRCERG